MNKHNLIYAEYFGLTEEHEYKCEYCGVNSSGILNIHHLIYRSQGGKDNIENLMCLCVDCHNQAHFKKEPYLTYTELVILHNKNIGKEIGR